MKRKFLVLLAILAVTCWATTASANLLDATYNLTTFNVAGYTGPFVQVDVAIINATSATITETGLSNYFIDGGHNAINFNFSAHVTIVTPPPSFTRYTGGSDNIDGYGTFDYGYDFNVPQYPGTQGPVTFTITGTGFTADILSLFATNPDGNFLVDAIGVNNGTGFTATGFADTATLVPVPPTVWLLGSGLVGLGLLGWRRRRS